MIAIALVALAAIAVAAPVRPKPRRVAPGVRRAPSRLVRLVDTLARQRARGRAPGARAVAAWCDEVARQVRSGSTLRDAITVLPVDAATERSTSASRLAIERGMSVADAAGRVADSGPHLRLALSVIGAASRIGGPSAASIEGTAMLLRQRAADLDERATHAAQARLSSHVMTAMPLLMLAVLVTTDGDVRSVVTSTVGAGCIVAGLALNAIGWWWMRRIVGIAS